MSDGCPRCGDYAAAGYLFCGGCGRRLENAPDQGDRSVGGAPSSEGDLRNVLEIVILIVSVAVLVVMAFEALILAANYVGVSQFLLGKAASFILIVPFPERIFTMSGMALQIYWTFVAAIIIACAAWVIRGFFVKAKELKDLNKLDAAEDTAAFWICISLCAMIFINYIIVFLTTSSGSDITVPDFGGNVEQAFNFANAAVWEEVITRMLYIGVPMAVISLIAAKKKKESLKCLLGGFGMSTTAVILIIISGTIFGLAHYPGWEDQVWKVVSSGIMGAFLGYVFVRFGLYASIMLHFVNNYLSSFSWIGLGAIETVLVLLFLSVGLAALIYIAVRLKGPKGSERLFTQFRLPLFRNGFIKEP